MRIFSYIFIALVTIFVINIVLSFSLPTYKNRLLSIRSNIFPISEKIPVVPIIDNKKSENDRLIESLDRIDKHIGLLHEAKTLNMSTGVNTGSNANPILQENASAKIGEIPLS